MIYPEYILTNVNIPYYLSHIVLNAYPKNLYPFIGLLEIEESKELTAGGFSLGLGKKSTIASNKGCTPLFRYAAPRNINVTF